MSLVFGYNVVAAVWRSSNSLDPFPSPSVAQSRKSRFRQVALASGLVSEEALEQAEATVRRTRRGEGEVSDEALAARLVQMEVINQWQAGELLKGRVKWTLGPYQIVDQIGAGGMGQVFKAEHTIMRRVVAIKVLPLNKSNADSIQNFRREIQAQAQLDHENLVRAYDAGQDGNVHFLVTEYVEGVDLRKLIKRSGKLSMPAAAGVICQAARGLDHAHSRGLIHRDVKPGNLLVTHEGVCKVSDLGLAGFLHEDESDERKNKTVGTADYLSPEQILTPEKLTTRCDIYSLGCTMYYAVTGKVPFPGGSTRDKARAHVESQPIDPRRLNGELDDEFVNVIGDMMEKDPDKRIPTAGDVIPRLAPWAGDDWPASVAGANIEPASLGNPPSIIGPPPLPSEFGQLGDTKPIGELPEVYDRQESPSVSGTQSHGFSSQETAPLDYQTKFAPPSEGLSTVVVVAILMAVCAALGVFGLILFRALW